MVWKWYGVIWKSVLIGASDMWLLMLMDADRDGNWQMRTGSLL
jgi:hypothetical protein